MSPRIVDALSEVVRDHDLFIVDQWGVLHDGHRPHPGAHAALAALRARGTVVLVSNTSRRVADNRALLARVGFETELWDGIVTAGEASAQALLAELPGARVCDVGAGAPPDHPLRGLGPALELVDDPACADALVATGVSAAPPERLDGVLRPAVERGLPLYCFNPDVVSVQPDGSFLYCAGAVAARYATLGGRVRTFGKPAPALYAAASALAPVWTRGLAVGDSLHHDILGARQAGLDSVLITRGIHWRDCGAPLGARPDPAAVGALCARTGVWPDAALARFVWDSPGARAGDGRPERD